eukprot:2392734-Pleurochrysis_carterae.AAC.2
MGVRAHALVLALVPLLPSRSLAFAGSTLKNLAPPLPSPCRSPRLGARNRANCLLCIRSTAGARTLLHLITQFQGVRVDLSRSFSKSPRSHVRGVAAACRRCECSSPATLRARFLQVLSNSASEAWRAVEERIFDQPPLLKTADDFEVTTPRCPFARTPR